MKHSEKLMVKNITFICSQQHFTCPRKNRKKPNPQLHNKNSVPSQTNGHLSLSFYGNTKINILHAMLVSWHMTEELQTRQSLALLFIFHFVILFRPCDKQQGQQEMRSMARQWAIAQLKTRATDQFSSVH